MSAAAAAMMAGVRRRLAVLLALMLPGLAWPAERIEREAEVSGLTRVAIAGSDIQLLVLAFAEGGGVSIPDRDQLPISAGMRVRVAARAAPVAGELPLACRIEVLAVPVLSGQGEQLQWAARPFEVYRNRSVECGDAH